MVLNQHIKSALFVQDRCLGSSLGADSADNANQCLADCQAIPECNWWAFDEATKFCTLTPDCDVVEACDTCVFGERTCEEGPEGITSFKKHARPD